MARRSNRSRILEAASEVIERDGIAHLTLEAVASEAGLTKGGLQYHFTSKTDLIEAIERDMLVRSEEAALHHLDGSLEESTPDERLAALILSQAREDVPPADLHIVVNSAVGGEVPDRDEFVARWTGEDERPLTPRQWVAVLASEGLWFRDALGETLTPGLREEIVREMLALSRSR